MAAEGPLRVALLSYRGHRYVGGQGVYVHHLSKALTADGHRVTVLSGPPHPVLDPSVEATELPSLDIWAEPHPMRKPRLWEWKDWTDAVEHASFATGNFSEPLAFSLRAWRHLRTRRADFDVVHDNQCLGWGVLALQLRGWPVLATVHHPITVDRRLELAHARTFRERFGKRRWYAFTRMQTRVVSRLDRVVTVSESSRADVGRDHRVPLEHLHVVPVGVDPDLFSPRPGLSRIPGRLITTASADVAMKGLRYLLEAVAKLRTERHIELVVIGRPKPDSAASRTLSELGLEDAVTFVSGVTDEQIVELYGQAELAVVPSLYEGFSLPAVEAMACGAPLVATTGGALPEVAGVHGRTCFLAEPGDSDSLASVIRAALDDDEARARVGAAGRRRVIDQWSWRHTAARTVEHYRAVIEIQQARAAATGAGSRKLSRATAGTGPGRNRKLDRATAWAGPGRNLKLGRAAPVEAG